MENEGQNMEQNTGQPEGGMEQTPPAAAPPTQGMEGGSDDKKSYGPIFGIVIIVILIVLAGFYFWGNQLQERVSEEVVSEEVTEDAGTAEEPLSPSDEIADIEADLDATLLDDLDAELGDIDAELNF